MFKQQTKSVFFIFFIFSSSIVEVFAQKPEPLVSDVCGQAFTAPPQVGGVKKQNSPQKGARRLIRTAVLLVGGLLPSGADAGYITIDDFTNNDQSDGLGQRSAENGFVQFGPPPVVTPSGNPGLSYAQMITGGSEADPTKASIVYRFLPSPIVAVAKFKIAVWNTQPESSSTGLFGVSVNGVKPLVVTLEGAQGGYSNFIADFTGVFGPNATVIDELRLDWVRPVGISGSRQLFVDFIEIQEVPEPATMALIGMAGAGGALMKRKKLRNLVLYIRI